MGLICVAAFGLWSTVSEGTLCLACIHGRRSLESTVSAGPTTGSKKHRLGPSRQDWVFESALGAGPLELSEALAHRASGEWTGKLLDRRLCRLLYFTYDSALRTLS